MPFDSSQLPSEQGDEKRSEKRGASENAARLRRIFLPPKLAQDWGEEQTHRQATWGELFYDLFFVIAAINLSHFIEKEPNARGVGIFFMYYTAFWVTWLNRVLFQSRIITEGLAFEVVALVHMLGVLGMVLHCGDERYYPQFAASYAVATGMHCLPLLATGVTLPRASAWVLENMAFTTPILALTIASVFFSWHVFIILTCVSHLLQFLLPLSSAFVPTRINIPLHVEHANERVGLVMMIFLGETIVGLGQQVLSDTAGQYTGILLGAVVVWNLHMVYFHTSPDQDHHALRLNRWRGFTWSYAHWILGALFLMLGAAVRMSLSSWKGGASHRLSLLRMLLAPEEASPSGYTAVHRDDIGRHAAWILCFSYALSLHVMLVIRGSHYFSLHNHLSRDPSVHLQSFSLFKSMGLIKLINLWWALLFFSPFIVYFIPFSNRELGALGLLGYITAHGFLFNFAETLITSKIVTSVVRRQMTLASQSAQSSVLVAAAKDAADADEGDAVPAPRRVKSASSAASSRVHPLPGSALQLPSIASSKERISMQPAPATLDGGDGGMSDIEAPEGRIRAATAV